MRNFLINKPHYAWIILAVCFVLYGGSMGIGYNCNGLFNVAISNEMGWSISRFTVSSICLGLTAVLTLNIVDDVLIKYNLRLVLTLSLVVYAVTLALKAVCNELWQFYLVYALNGAACAFLFYVPVPMLLRNWFAQKNGTAMGIAMFSSGLMGTIMNPVISRLIENFGWRNAAVINALIVAVFSIPLVLLFSVRKPSDIGILPYGATEETNDDSVTNSKVSDHLSKETDIQQTALQKKYLVISMIIGFFTALISLIPQQLSHFSNVNGFPASIGAMFVSIAMAGNMVSKGFMGVAIDRFGNRKTFIVSFCLLSFAYIVFAYGTVLPVSVLLATASLTGISAANNVLAVPNVVATYTTKQEYPEYMSKVSTGTMTGVAFGSYVCSLLYDLVGSYRFEFILFAAVNMLCLGAILYIIPKK